jgi:hypothetical protein
VRRWKRKKRGCFGPLRKKAGQTLQLCDASRERGLNVRDGYSAGCYLDRGDSHASEWGNWNHVKIESGNLF